MGNKRESEIFRTESKSPYLNRGTQRAMRIMEDVSPVEPVNSAQCRRRTNVYRDTVAYRHGYGASESTTSSVNVITKPSSFVFYPFSLSRARSLSSGRRRRRRREVVVELSLFARLRRFPRSTARRGGSGARMYFNEIKLVFQNLPTIFRGLQPDRPRPVAARDLRERQIIITPSSISNKAAVYTIVNSDSYR